VEIVEGCISDQVKGWSVEEVKFMLAWAKAIMDVEES